MPQRSVRGRTGFLHCGPIWRRASCRRPRCGYQCVIMIVVQKRELSMIICGARRWHGTWITQHRSLRNGFFGGLPMKRCSHAFDSWTAMSNSLSILIPHSGWGAASGGLAGLSAGLIVLALLRIELNVAVFMLLVFTASAAILGAWICTPIETSSVPPPELREEDSARTRLLVDSDLRDRAMLSKTFRRRLTRVSSSTT